MHGSVDSAYQLRCVVCRSLFDFAAGEAALVLRHVAYGYDFVHDGDCLAAAREWIFPEPGFDCAAFARDPERQKSRYAIPEIPPCPLRLEADPTTEENHHRSEDRTEAPRSG